MQIARRRLALILVAVAALALMPFLVAAKSSAGASKRVALTCGQTVTTSVTLTADITGCGGDGLIVGANGITINLNGHLISGSSGQYGVLNGSHSSDVIENGKITGFARGIEIEGGTATRLQGLRITGNSGAGVFTFFPAIITANVIYANGGGGITVGCCASDKSQITNNVINGNTGSGISMSFTAAGSVISGNRVLSNTGIGVNVSAADVSVTGNTANANGTDGFDLTSSDTLPPLKATSNKAYFNTQLGISFGASDTDGGGNKAAGNGSAHQCENIVCS
jgi:hypothetical protein